jgi:hypothetical protein
MQLRFMIEAGKDWNTRRRFEPNAIQLDRQNGSERTQVLQDSCGFG